MNIFDFVNSKDIKEHLIKINYQFNSLETAWLIFQCEKISINEKHKAWQELIKSMQDCEIPKRLNTIPQKSLHQFLKKYIEEEEKFLQEYYFPSKDWVYTVEWYEQNMWYDLDKIFRNFEAAQNEILKQIKEWNLNTTYRIKKRKLETDFHINMYFYKEKHPYFYNYFLEAQNEILSSVFDGLFFIFPTPFQKGDVLCEYNINGNETNGFCRGPFVMKGITTEDISKRIKETGDSSDMNAWGIFQNEDGSIYQEVMFNYMNLEYFRGDFVGKRRILKAFSCFLKNEIDEELLCKAYHHFLWEEYTKNSITKDYSQEILNKLNF